LAERRRQETESFGRRLATAFAAQGHLCVGIDPHGYLLGEWKLLDDAGGVREFGLRVVDAAAGRVGIVKLQIAFFERHGSAGYAALEVVLAAARAAGLLVIADVKRGDLGSSIEAYGQAWLTPGHPLEADAITVSAYQGFGSIEALLRLAEQGGKGAFVLTATSNPEAAAIQTAAIGMDRHRGYTVAASILADVDAWNSQFSPGSMGSVGAVIGATVDLSRYGIQPYGVEPYGVEADGIEPDGIKAGAEVSSITASITPILAPGFGHQGARIGDLRIIFGRRAAATIVSESRSILSAGPAGLAKAISRQANAVAEAFAHD
jgi:orotidine-5'-phosphate decarboxylase